MGWPNRISLTRIVLVAPFVICLMHLSEWGDAARWAALGICALIAGSDWLDGYLARRVGHATPLGKFLDPLADKLLVCTALILLIPLGRVEAWMVAVIIGREMAVTTLRGLAGAEGVVIAANRLGKFKNLAQLSATNILILHYDYFFLKIHLLGTILIWIALVLTIWSGVHYFAHYLKKP